MGAWVVFALFTLFTIGCDHAVKVEKRFEPVQYDRSPLIRMMDRVSIEEFEKEVQEHPAWINQKSEHLPDRVNRTVLTAAAITCRTNHVRILIKHGADVGETLKWCKQYDYPDAAQLIFDACKELGKGIECL